MCVGINKYILCMYIWFVHICVWHFHYPFMNWWTARLVPFLHYHEYSRNQKGYASICVLGYRTLWKWAHEWLICTTWCSHFLWFYFLRTLHTFSPWVCFSFHCPYQWISVSISSHPLHTCCPLFSWWQSFWLEWVGLIK